MTRRSLMTLALILLVLATPGSPAPRPVSAQPASGTIAYVRPNDQTGDEIWLIEPDGSNNRRIWSIGLGEISSDPEKA